MAGWRWWPNRLWRSAEVFPVELVDVERAKAVVNGKDRLSARDAVHVAVMERYRVDGILTFDTSFDGVPGIERLTL